jgi:hypothetical protein
MTRPTRIVGYRLDVSARLRQRGSKRVRVVRPAARAVAAVAFLAVL